MRLAFVTIIALLSLTLLLPDGQSSDPVVAEATPQVKKSKSSTENGNLTNDSPELPYDSYFRLLRLSAGKKQGYTQRQRDSLENIISIRKKF